MIQYHHHYYVAKSLLGAVCWKKRHTIPVFRDGELKLIQWLDNSQNQLLSEFEYNFPYTLQWMTVNYPAFLIFHSLVAFA